MSYRMCAPAPARRRPPGPALSHGVCRVWRLSSALTLSALSLPHPTPAASERELLPFIYAIGAEVRKRRTEL